MKLTHTKIPKDLAEFIIKRIEPLHKDYIASQNQSMKFLGVSQEFGIKELMISCYTQGLQDAKTAINVTQSQ